ncbi:EfeM/EfeO family lipoprotein [Calidifontibacter terrae]
MFPDRPTVARARWLPTLTAGLLGAALVAGCTDSPAQSSRSAAGASSSAAGVAAAPQVSVDASVDSCGRGWTTGHAGQQTISVHNTDSRGGEVYLTDPAGKVYAEIDNLAAGTTSAFSIELGPGSYLFHCAMEDEATVAGRPVTVTGTTAHPAVGVLPVSQADLLPATLGYQKYVTGALPALITQVTALQTDVRSGNRAAAKRDWLTAHLSYERLGAAYGAFGDADTKINGLPYGLPKGTADPAWTGFHAIEKRLWSGGDAQQLVDTLVTDVRALPAQFASEQIDPLEVTLRAHEIVENTVQFELTGKTDFGSHSGLATARANLDGTTTVLNLLKPLLSTRGVDVAGLERQVGTARAALAGTDQTALAALPRPKRQAINASMSALAEALAPIASILEPRLSELK